MLDFPVFLYKDGGLFDRKGGTYSVSVVGSELEYNDAIAAGFCYSHTDDIEAGKVIQPLKGKLSK